LDSPWSKMGGVDPTPGPGSGANPPLGAQLPSSPHPLPWGACPRAWPHSPWAGSGWARALGGGESPHTAPTLNPPPGQAPPPLGARPWGHTNPKPLGGVLKGVAPGALGWERVGACLGRWGVTPHRSHPKTPPLPRRQPPWEHALGATQPLNPSLGSHVYILVLSPERAGGAIVAEPLHFPTKRATGSGLAAASLLVLKGHRRGGCGGSEGEVQPAAPQAAVLSPSIADTAGLSARTLLTSHSAVRAPGS
jgi:hypothetical protein